MVDNYNNDDILEIKKDIAEIKVILEKLSEHIDFVENTYE